MSNLSQEEREEMIDLYLSGKMPENERIKFEKAMESDPDLKKDVHIYACIIHGIREVGLEEENKRLQRIAEEAKILEKEYVVMRIPDYNGSYNHQLMDKEIADEIKNEPFHYVEWEGTKADIIMDAGRTTFTDHYEPIHENPIETTFSLQDLAKGWGILDKEDIKMMEQIRAELENEKQNSQIVGLEGYSEKDIEKLVRDHFKNVLEGSEIDAEIVAVKVIGSRVNGNSNQDSDLDVLLEYKGKAKEDGLFNVLNHSEEGRLYIEGIPVDINPITEGKSGTIQQFLERNKDYVKSVDIDNHNISVMEENEKLQATIKDVTSRDEQFRYQLLDRLKQDCNYFLDFGNRNENSLWAGNAKDHVAVMQALWESLPQKPEWLTKEELADYAGKMLESEKKVQEKVADAKAHPEPLSEEQSKVAETKDFKSVIDSASRELQSLLENGSIDFLQQINKPLSIVNDDSLPDVEYAYISGLSINNGKVSIDGEMEVNGTPYYINNLYDLDRQGISNLLEGVRDIVQWKPEISLTEEQALMVADHYGYRAEVEQDMKDGMRPEWALRKHDIMPSKEAFEEMKDLNDPEKLPIVDAVPMLLDKVIPNKGDELMLSAIGGQIDIQYIGFGYQEIENVKSIKNTGDGYVATNGEITVDVSRLATGPDKEYFFSLIKDNINLLKENPIANDVQQSVNDPAKTVQEEQKDVIQDKHLSNPDLLLEMMQQSRVHVVSLNDGMKIENDNGILMVDKYKEGSGEKNLSALPKEEQNSLAWSATEVLLSNLENNLKRMSEVAPDKLYVDLPNGNTVSMDEQGHLQNYDNLSKLEKIGVINAYAGYAEVFAKDIFNIAIKNSESQKLYLDPNTWIQKEADGNLSIVLVKDNETKKTALDEINGLTQLTMISNAITQHSQKTMQDISALRMDFDKEYLFSVINNSVKQNRENSMSKETQPGGGTVNAVQEGQNAQPEKKAVTDLGKEAKAIITGDALAEKTRKTLESSEQSVVLIRTRDRDTKANVYQAFGEDAGKINAASKKAEMSTPTIGENKYQVVTFSDKEAKNIAKDLADANLQVHLITKQGIAIKNDNAFTQDTTQQAQQKGNKEEKGEQKTVKEAPAKEATVKETPANGKEEEYQRRAGKAAELQQPDSFVALNIKSSKDSYFQAFGKDADYAAKILDKQVKTTEGNISYLSFKEDDLNKVSAAAAKDGKTAVIKEYAAPILEKAQEKNQEKAQVNTVDLKPDSKVEFDISKNLHAKGIYDIKLIVDDNKVAAHHLSKEDRDAFFKKDISGKDLVEKYFSKELNGASPEVTRTGNKQEKEPLMTTVNGEKVTDARVFTSEKGNNFFVAAIEGKQLKPQFIPDEMAKGFKEGNVKIQDMMEKAYPSKVMPKVPEEQFKSNKLSDGREFSFFRIEKESNQEKKDFGKYRLEAVVDGQKLKSAALPVKDLNEYFDRVTTKSALVEKHLGESLNMKAAYDKYKLPEGAKMGENTTFRVEKDNAQRRFFISGEVNGNSLDRKQLSYNDGASFLKKAASEEQLGAKYFSKEVSNIIKSTNTMAIKQEHSATLKR